MSLTNDSGGSCIAFVSVWINLGKSRVDDNDDNDGVGVAFEFVTWTTGADDWRWR